MHELLLGLFVTVTTPITLMLLARAAVFRDRVEGNPAVPSREPAPQSELIAGRRSGPWRWPPP